MSAGVRTSPTGSVRRSTPCRRPARLQDRLREGQDLGISPTDALEERRDHYRGADRAGVRSRAQQDSLWNRQQLSNQLRSLLREYYPAALAAFEPWRNGLCRPEAQELLKAAPTPTRAARLTRTQLEAALKRAGRKRGITAEAERLRDVFREDYAHQPPLVEDAVGKQMLALLVQLEAACTTADDLAEAVEEAFPQHPIAEIILSFPGLGVQLGARVLAEIGDDRNRCADARGLKAYTGSSTITRASGKKSSIIRRWVTNDRLNHVGYLWAFAAITASPGAKAHYRHRRDEHGDWHAAAQRNLFNRQCHEVKAGPASSRAFLAGGLSVGRRPVGGECVGGVSDLVEESFAGPAAELDAEAVVAGGDPESCGEVAGVPDPAGCGANDLQDLVALSAVSRGSG